MVLVESFLIFSNKKYFVNFYSKKDKPVIEDLKISFTVILPNMNYKYNENSNNNLNEDNITSQEKTILDFLDTHESIRRTTVEDLLGVSTCRTCEIIQEMIIKELIFKSGTGRNTRY